MIRAEAGKPGQGPLALSDRPLSPSLREPVELVRVLKSCTALVERESWFGCLYNQSVRRTTFISLGGREPCAVFLCFSWQRLRVVFEASFSKGLLPVLVSPSLSRGQIRLWTLGFARPKRAVDAVLSVFLRLLVAVVILYN